jgi:hypothetical protein
VKAQVCAGRSTPSREMVLHLANCLDVPLREHNALLLAAGYAPQFPERELGDDALHAVNSAVRLMLEHQVVVDRRWNLIDDNAGGWLLSADHRGMAPARRRPRSTQRLGPRHLR